MPKTYEEILREVFQAQKNKDIGLDKVSPLEKHDDSVTKEQVLRNKHNRSNMEDLSKMNVITPREPLGALGNNAKLPDPPEYSGREMSPKEMQRLRQFYLEEQHDA
jgi:hypothetical protein